MAGVTRRRPFLTGASVNRAGTVQRGKMVIYAIRQFEDGTQLINWNTEQPRDDHKPNDWATLGRIEDFIEPFRTGSSIGSISSRSPMPSSSWNIRWWIVIQSIAGCGTGSR